MAYRSSASAVSNSGTSISATPASVAANDYLGAGLTVDVTGNTITPPSGFTQQVNNDQAAPDGQTHRYFDKIATGSDAFGFTISPGNEAVLIVAAFSGRDTSNPRSTAPVATSNTSSNASPVTSTYTGITATAGDDILVFKSTDHGNSTWGYTQISGYTERQDATSTAWSTAAMDTVDNVGAGATGSLSSTITLLTGADGTGYSGIVVAIKAAATGPAAPGVIARPEFILKRAGTGKGSTLRGATYAWSLRGTAAQPASGPQNYTRTLSDSVTIIDAPNRTAQSFRLIPLETITLLDMIVRGKMNGRNVFDNLTVLDTLIVGKMLGRTVADNIALSEALLRRAMLTHGTQDQVSVTDDVKRRVDVFRQLLDSLTVTESISSTVSIGISVIQRLLHEDITVVEAVQRTVRVYRVAPENIGLIDAVTRAAQIYRFITDSLTMDERLQATVRAFRYTQDQITAADSLSRSAKLIRGLLDSLTVTDTWIVTLTQAGVLIISRVLQDGINLNDAIQRGLKTYRLTADQAGVTDDIKRYATMSRTVQDVLSVAENAARFLMLNRITSDAVQAADVAFRYALLTRLLHEDVMTQDNQLADITYFQTLIGFVMLYVAGEPIITALDEAPVELTMETLAQVALEIEPSDVELSMTVVAPILAEMRNL